jgi:hypothetical protein
MTGIEISGMAHVKRRFLTWSTVVTYPSICIGNVLDPACKCQMLPAHYLRYCMLDSSFLGMRIGSIEKKIRSKYSMKKRHGDAD